MYFLIASCKYHSHHKDRELFSNPSYKTEFLQKRYSLFQMLLYYFFNLVFYIFCKLGKDFWIMSV